jgi:hypothetical protein
LFGEDDEIFEYTCNILRNKMVKVKVQRPLYRPGVAQKVPRGLGSQIS